MSLPVALGLHVAGVILALVGVEARRPALLAIGKPLATATLLLVLGVPPWPSSFFAQALAVGLVFALVGDVALLFEGTLPFMLGLGFFLVAHVIFLVGAWTVGGAAVFGSPVLVVCIGLYVALALIMRRVVAGAPAGMRAPVVIYGIALASMASAMVATLAGPWPTKVAALAAGGGVVFFASDGILAWNRFVRPLPHGQTWTLVTYWLGQVGIALAGRWGSE